MRLLSNNPEVVRCEFGWSQVSEFPPDGSPPAVSPQFCLAIERLTTTTFFFSYIKYTGVRLWYFPFKTDRVLPLITNFTLSLFSFFSKAHYALLFLFIAIQLLNFSLRPSLVFR